MPAPVPCGQCNAPFDEPSDLPAGRRLPCPHCGSMARAFTVTASGDIVLGGLATVGVAYGVVTQAGLLLQAVIVPGKNTSDGRIIESVAPAWLEIARLMQRDPSAIYQIDDRKWEEIIAGAYKKAGFEEVILTPRSGDFGALPVFGADLLGFTGLLTGRRPSSPAFALIPGRTDFGRDVIAVKYGLCTV